jgi:hypothetical protein
MPKPGYLGPLSDPAVRKERARRASAARNSIDFHIGRLVGAAENLTDEQRDRLLAALQGGDR